MDYIEWETEACGPSWWCFIQLEWKRIDEDWQKEPWFYKQVRFIHVRSMELLLPSFLSVQKEEEKAFSYQAGRENR